MWLEIVSRSDWRSLFYAPALRALGGSLYIFIYIAFMVLSFNVFNGFIYIIYIIIYISGAHLRVFFVRFRAFFEKSFRENGVKTCFLKTERFFWKPNGFCRNRSVFWVCFLIWRAWSPHKTKIFKNRMVFYKTVRLSIALAFLRTWMCFDDVIYFELTSIFVE